MTLPPNLMPLSPSYRATISYIRLVCTKTPVYKTCKSACHSWALPGSMVVFQLPQLLEVMFCLFEGIQLIVSEDPLVKVLQQTSLQ